jgi:hypothetical protein
MGCVGFSQRSLLCEPYRDWIRDAIFGYRTFLPALKHLPDGGRNRGLINSRKGGGHNGASSPKRLNVSCLQERW